MTGRGTIQPHAARACCGKKRKERKEKRKARGELDPSAPPGDISHSSRHAITGSKPPPPRDAASPSSTAHFSAFLEAAARFLDACSPIDISSLPSFSRRGFFCGPCCGRCLLFRVKAHCATFQSSTKRVQSPKTSSFVKLFESLFPFQISSPNRCQLNQSPDSL